MITQGHGTKASDYATLAWPFSAVCGGMHAQQTVQVIASEQLHDAHSRRSLDMQFRATESAPRLFFASFCAALPAPRAARLCTMGN